MASPLFYEKVVPLDREAHRNLRLHTADAPLAYARDANLIPATVDEFAAAMPEMPIAFLPGANRPAAVFVTGLKPGTSVFVTDNGLWDAGYVPAYLRRYPFIIGDVADGEPLLCVDEAYRGLNETEGVRLFSESGEPQKIVANALSLSQGYRDAAQRTDAFCDTLQRLGLFRTVTLDAKLPDGQTTVVHGLMTVDEEALDALSEEQVGQLHSKNMLKPIYAHLFSLKALERLSDKLKHNTAAAA